MGGGRVGHVALKGPSVLKEIIVATVAGCAAGSVWKSYQWKQQKKTRAFYEMLDRGEISLTRD